MTRRPRHPTSPRLRPPVVKLPTSVVTVFCFSMTPLTLRSIARTVGELISAQPTFFSLDPATSVAHSFSFVLSSSLRSLICPFCDLSCCVTISLKQLNCLLVSRKSLSRRFRVLSYVRTEKFCYPVRAILVFLQSISNLNVHYVS